jgi:uncharacterized C2H2 Zn-finger protein
MIIAIDGELAVRCPECGAPARDRWAAIRHTQPSRGISGTGG